MIRLNVPDVVGVNYVAHLNLNGAIGFINCDYLAWSSKRISAVFTVLGFLDHYKVAWSISVWCALRVLAHVVFPNDSLFSV